MVGGPRMSMLTSDLYSHQMIPIKSAVRQLLGY